MTLTFEEFQTVRRRQRSIVDAATAASKRQNKANDSTPASPSADETRKAEDDTPSTPKDDAIGKWRGWRQSLEYCIEDPKVQIVVLVLVYLDILLGTWSMATQLASESTGEGHSDEWSIPLHFIRNTILYLHCFELLLQMIIFHVRFFSHWGYAIDTFLIAARILKRHDADPMNNYYLHLSCFIRIWRYIRLVQTHIAIEAKKHNITKKELSSHVKSIDEWTTKALLLQEDVEREKVLRIQNEDMAKGCLEEMETLREALQIAAVDVAAALKGDHRMGMDIVEYDEGGIYEDDNIKAWVTNPVPIKVAMEDALTYSVDE